MYVLVFKVQSSSIRAETTEANSQRYTSMLASIICLFYGNQLLGAKMISWKHSFSRLNEEYELAKKKKQVLGSLLEKGKISETTHSLFTREIDEAVAEIDGQRKALLGKMASKEMELQEQIRTLEILLANFEIQHVTDDVDEETYRRETELLSTGLQTAKKELDDVQCAVNQLSNDEMIEQQDVEPAQIQDPEPERKLSEEPPQTNEEGHTEPVQAVAETIQCKEETQHPETEAKAEEKQP